MISAKKMLNWLFNSQLFALLLIRGIGLGLLFLAQISLARVLENVVYGTYATAISLATIVVLFVKLGTDISIIRLINRYKSRKNWRLFNGVWRFFRWLIVVGSAIVMTVGAGLYFIWPGISVTTMMALFIVFPLALVAIQRNFLIALGHPIKGIAIDQLLLPILLILASGVIWYNPNYSTGPWSVLFHGIVVGVLSIIGWWWCRKTMPLVAQQAQPNYQLKPWFYLSLPMILTVEGGVLIAQADVVMVGGMIGVAEAGYFSVAAKIAVLANIGLTTFNNVAAAKMAHAYEQRCAGELQQVITKYARISFAIACIVAVIIWLFSIPILSLFGPEFIKAQTVLLILLACQVVMTAFGPVGFLLTMTARQTDAAIITAISIVFNIVGNLILIPIWGVTGAATATLIVFVFRFTAMAYVAHRSLQVKAFWI